MRQETLAEEGFEKHRKTTCREQFLEEMEQIIPWAELAAVIEPFYPKPEGAGRRLIGIERMLRDYLQENGLKISRRTIVDATIINAPSSTKNKDGQRDPEMRQTKKGNQWDFGMKAHIGVDSKTKLIHSAVATAANVHDSQVLGDLLHGEETTVWGDSAYTGQRETIRRHAPQARDFTQRKAHRHRPLSDEDRARNRNKSKVRARGEHPLLVLKRIFGFTKVRYRGLHKNANRLFVACGLVNLYMMRRRLLLVT